MKLYGVAISVTHADDHSDLFNVTCNPLEVTNGKRGECKILEELRPHPEKTPLQFHAGDTKSLMKCFVKVVDTLDKTVKLQEQSCTEQRIKYVPIAVEIGQDSRKPIHVDALHAHLFGERLFPRPTRPQIEQKLVRSKEVEKESQSEFGKKYADLREEEQDFVKAVLNIDGFVEAIDEQQDVFDAEIEAAQQTRRNYLRGHRFPDGFNAACKKLPELLSKCSLMKGSFSFSEDVTPMAQPELDNRLIMLKKRINEGDYKAHNEVIDLAEQLGREWGEAQNKELHQFWYVPPDQYDTVAQQKHPGHAFFHWQNKFTKGSDGEDDKPYIKAFHRGFDAVYVGPRERTLSLPLDPRTPYFVIPTRDYALEAGEVANHYLQEQGREPWGKRFRVPEGLAGNKEWGEKIGMSAVRGLKRDR
jgi:hypothetical protein